MEAEIYFFKGDLVTIFEPQLQELKSFVSALNSRTKLHPHMCELFRIGPFQGLFGTTEEFCEWNRKLHEVIFTQLFENSKSTQTLSKPDIVLYKPAAKKINYIFTSKVICNFRDVSIQTD